MASYRIYLLAAEKLTPCGISLPALLYPLSKNYQKWRLTDYFNMLNFLRFFSWMSITLSQEQWTFKFFLHQNMFSWFIGP